MSGQGYHLAISESQVNMLLTCHDEFDALDTVNDFLEEMWASQPDDVHGGYKDWDVLLLCLTGGTFDPEGGTYPLNQCFFGGRLLASEGSIVNLVMPAAVRDVAASLSTLEKGWFTNRFSVLFPEEDYEAYYEKLQQLRDHYRKAAATGMGVLFYTDDCMSDFFDPGRNPSNRR
jgi:hypothetical protein